METEYLRQFALLAKECHFQTAADLLYISQSTLSKHIAALEKELGEPLFYRTTRQVSLTPFGEKMLPYAEKIIGIVNACESELLSKYKQEVPGLHVGVSPFVSISRLMAAKMHCEGLAPDKGNMVFTETASLQLREGLRSGRFQMVIDGNGPEWEQEEIASVPYAKDYLCALLHEKQDLSANF
ncbi:MAG: LysR family transcriptional regulator, partial [Clostridia bacterium]|nr:LysR family transcriptional regulator [Clostridia bacterium]